MLNNYRYPHNYPQPQLLKDQYRYAMDRFEMELPLPGYSVKVPFQQKQLRFLTVNRRKRQIDYLKDHIQHKCDMEELHYQAKIQQMKRENQYNRQKLEQLLRQQPPRLFQIPNAYTDEARSVSSNLQKLSLRQLQNRKQEHLIDSIDKLKMQNQNKNNKSMQNLSDDSSEDSQQKAEEKKRRLAQLDYVYKRKGSASTKNHFADASFAKKEKQKMKEKQQQKRQQYEWIQKVRKAKEVKFADANDSDDSSKPSETSTEKKKKKQQQQRKQKQKKIVIGSARYGYSRLPMVQQQNSVSQRISDQTPSKKSEQFSNMSDYSRYAQKKAVAPKKKKLKNIFEGDEDEEGDNVRQNPNKKGYRKV